MQLTGKIETIRLPTTGNSYEFSRDDKVYQGFEFSGYGTATNTDTIAAATNKSDDSTSFRDNNSHSLSAGQKLSTRLVLSNGLNMVDEGRQGNFDQIRVEYESNVWQHHQ